MADLIERQQAVEAFETAAKSGASIKDITLILENLPSAKQEAPDINVGNMDTTTHDSIPAETGKNDGDGTSGDCISRQAAIDTEDTK